VNQEVQKHLQINRTLDVMFWKNKVPLPYELRRQVLGLISDKEYQAGVSSYAKAVELLEPLRIPKTQKPTGET
jgi:hypothetical protein